MFRIIHEAIVDRRVAHIALSGGTTPIVLLQYITVTYPSFPWQHVHIWFVDERCVPLTSDDSNFHVIDIYLLQSISIPYTNIHPINVNTWSRAVCDPDVDVPGMYKAEINSHISNARLDYVLLGMGRDGHTASLFPNQPDVSEDFIAYASSSSNATCDRVTMTHSLINNAHHIAILVIGKHKAPIIEELRRIEMNVTQYPITGVQPTYGELTWYIDDDALTSIPHPM